VLSNISVAVEPARYEVVYCVTVLVMVKGEHWLEYVHTTVDGGLGYGHTLADVGNIGTEGNPQRRELWSGKFRGFRAVEVAKTVVFKTVPDSTTDPTVTVTGDPDWTIVSVITTVISTSGHVVGARVVVNSVVVHSSETQSS
jgi:hypothetical protein